jgi:intein/homing endonuclease
MYDNMELIMEQGASMIEYYRSDPVMAAYDLLNVDLAPIQRVILRDMWFKNFDITVMGRGGGKSQSVGSMSFINNKGLCYLYEEFEPIPEFLRAGETLEINSDKTIYTSEGFKPVKRVSLEKKIDGLKLTTQLGLENKGSDHHPLLTMDADGNFYYKQIQDFNIGDYVCIQRGQRSFGEEGMSDDDAYLIGLFIGDGTIGPKASPQCITTSDDYIESFCTDYCKRNSILYRIDEDKRTKDTIKIVFKQFAWFFDKYQIKRCLSYHKEVPKIVRCANEKVQVQFLRGLFDTDGGFEQKGIVTFCSVSEKLVKEVQMMLLNFGIISRKREKKTESSFGKAFILIISGEDVEMFYKLVGFNLWRKQSLLKEYIESKKFNTNKNIIPFIKNTIVKDLANKYGSQRSFSKLFSDKRYRFDDGNRKNLSYSVLDKIVNTTELYNVDPDIYDKLLRIRNRNYYFDEVVSVEKWSGDCYDFEMDMAVEPNYFSNGFICHNTFLLGVNAVLHALLFPGYRVGLIAPSFRQSKMIFSEVEKIYQRAPILREACEKRPVRGSDTCYLRFRGTDYSNGSFIEALPIGVDGAKIRGSRFYLIQIDELAQMTPDIIDLVIRPMAAVSLEPMQRVRERQQQEEMIKQGLATEDDFIGEAANKMIMTSSGYFKFNHMWRRMKSYWKAMKEEGENTKYAVHQVPYQLLPPAFLDEENIKEARRTMSSIEFMMEYEAAMVSDSDGFFKASLIEACSINSAFSIQPVGQKGKEYVLGIDPNQGGKASCGVIIIEIGEPHKIVYVKELKKKTTQDMVMAFQNLTDIFNVVRIFMDSQGGGKPIRDLLQEGYNNHIPILDMDDETTKGKYGKSILQLINPTPAWINDANFDTLAMFEHKDLR